MKYWEIAYYKTRSFIATKHIKDECPQRAIKKARVKHIVDIQEISEEDYKSRLNK